MANGLQSRFVTLLGNLRRARGAGKTPSSYRAVLRQERIFYWNVLRPGMTAFDVGANVGELTALFANAVAPDGRVHAFEPTPRTFHRLQDTCEALGLENVTANRTALSDRTGLLDIHVFPDAHSTKNSAIRRPAETVGLEAVPCGVESVPAITLDEYCVESGVDFIDLLKIDVEGLELAVLQGSERMFRRRCVALCVFEFGATTIDAGVSPSDLTDFFAGVGFRVRNLIEGEPAFPGGSSRTTARFSMHVATPV